MTEEKFKVIWSFYLKILKFITLQLQFKNSAKTFFFSAPADPVAHYERLHERVLEEVSQALQEKEERGATGDEEWCLKRAETLKNNWSRRLNVYSKSLKVSLCHKLMIWLNILISGPTSLSENGATQGWGHCRNSTPYRETLQAPGHLCNQEREEHGVYPERVGSSQDKGHSGNWKESHPGLKLLKILAELGSEV